ncbi:TRAP transporter substrate-binding protein [Orrella daihaiensis]|uniref:TRAP transporter substrate-binding protein n=1 Tax=Orrella daihaiensis TaxID=2782176 RepID=A0ABY4AKB9_9BURK|nr:TRAP transporter substrate-binding protein [Orrella daihaiensis]UOD50715.1 TRAP transporter substrate-binding protein [Orrella daihaiensis]
MKSWKRLALIAAMTTASSMALAAEVKVAMNGANDPSKNAEAAFAQGFADALKGTDFEVKVFPSETLGKEKERFDQVAQGLLEVNLASVPTTYGMSPVVKGVALPFLWESNDQFDKVIAQTDMLERMNAPLLDNGIRVAGFNYIGVGIGIHNTKKPVAKIEDLQGLRFRALNAEQLAFAEALGATGTVIAWSEVANAIQTGVADGYLNPPNSAIRTGHTAFLKHFTPANISPSTRIVLISEDWYSGLDATQKQQIDKALAAGIAANRAWVKNWEGEVRKKHQEAGVTITELAPGERNRMAEAGKKVWAQTMTPEQLQLYLDAIKQVQ